MTDWIKDNKFAAALLLVAILGAIGAYLFSDKKSAAYDAAKEEFDMGASTLQRLEGRKPYPNAANLEDRRKEVVKYRGKVEGLQKALLSFRPENFAKITPAEFTTQLNEVGEGLKSTYTDRGIAFPDAWQMGFEIYTSSPPKDASTAYLDYQLSGLEWLYEQLAAAGPDELLNVCRPVLPIEKGDPMMPSPERGSQQAATPPYFALPVELTFRGRESSVRKLLSALADSKEFFFVVRSVRVQNVKFGVPPSLSDVEFEDDAAEAADDLFADFPDDTDMDDGTTPAEGDSPVPDLEPEEDQPGAGRILGQVLGDEELHVFLQLELILFRGDVELPAVK